MSGDLPLDSATAKISGFGTKTLKIKEGGTFKVKFKATDIFGGIAEKQVIRITRKR